MAVYNVNSKEDTVMDSDLEKFYRCVKLLPDEDVGWYLARTRKCFDIGVYAGIISADFARECRQIKNNVFGDNIMKMFSVKDLKIFVKLNNLINNKKWSEWIMLFFATVSEGKYISCRYIENILENWEYGFSYNNEVKYIRKSSIRTTLSRLIELGLVEKISLIDPKFKGEDGVLLRRNLAKEKVFGPVVIEFGDITQSVFSCTYKGRDRIESILERYKC